MKNTNIVNLEEITSLSRQAMADLLETTRLKPGKIVVVGCSTSEIQGKRIGSSSAIEVAGAVINGILPLIKGKGLCLAAQCCEHLNRALVIETDIADTNGFEIVSVVPHLKAGGAFGTEVYRLFDEPAVVESISASAGLDIGDTFIGMHIKNTVVPVRGSIKEIGLAHVTMAKTRPKLIGGERSVYKKYV
jgi:uncharacterized protein (TIGR01440 family)